MRGLDPRIHRKKPCSRRWIAGSSPAMTWNVEARLHWLLHWLLRFGDAGRRGLGDELGGLQRGGAERGRDPHPERNQDGGSRDRHEGDLGIALGGEVFDSGA